MKVLISFGYLGCNNYDLGPYCLYMREQMTIVVHGRKRVEGCLNFPTLYLNVDLHRFR